MNRKVFDDGLTLIESTFFGVNGGARYDKALSTAIYNAIQKWRETTWNKVIEFLTYSFKPGYGISLPVPADFKKTYLEIPVDENYIPISKQNNGEYATAKDIENIMRPLMQKLQGGKDFRPRSPYIDGKFICEICFRAGCDGASEERLRNGCFGYLTETRAQEIEEMKKIEHESTTR